MKNKAVVEVCFVSGDPVACQITSSHLNAGERVGGVGHKGHSVLSSCVEIVLMEQEVRADNSLCSFDDSLKGFPVSLGMFPTTQRCH